MRGLCNASKRNLSNLCAISSCLAESVGNPAIGGLIRESFRQSLRKVATQNCPSLPSHPWRGLTAHRREPVSTGHQVISWGDSATLSRLGAILRHLCANWSTVSASALKRGEMKSSRHGWLSREMPLSACMLMETSPLPKSSRSGCAFVSPVLIFRFTATLKAGACFCLMIRQRADAGRLTTC